MTQELKIVRKLSEKVGDKNSQYMNDVYTTLNIMGNVCTPRNSTFLTLSLEKDAQSSFNQIAKYFTGAFDHLLKLSGLKRHQVACVGFYLRKPAPHYHLLLYSVKSRKVGYTIARLPMAVIEDFGDYWSSLKHGHSSKMKTVFDTGKLVDYLLGHRNCGLKGQEPFLVEHNVKLAGKRYLKDINEIINKK